MRARLFSVILGGSLFLAGQSALADNESAASKGGAKAGEKSAKASPIVTDPTPKKDAAAEKASADPTNPPATQAPIVTDTVPSKGAPDKKSPEGTKSQEEAKPGADALASPAPEGVSNVSDVQALEPHKRPVPEGYAAAAELFKQRKFPQAEKEFEKIVQSGTADVNTHLCLAHCFLQQKIYTKAVKEFDWLAKYAKNSMTLQKSCEATARSLRNAMSGLCPANCLKINDPRWTTKGGNKVLLLPRAGGGVDTITPDSLGHLVVNEHGYAVVKGICPVCDGTTHVNVLKDGGPMPRI